jgi:hypothetical protein
MSTSVSASATSVAIFASNPSCRGRAVRNDSAAALYLEFGGAATTESCVKLDPGDYYEFQAPRFAGAVYGIWDSATGYARVTEW